jgi:hypothetical protein
MSGEFPFVARERSSRKSEAMAEPNQRPPSPSNSEADALTRALEMELKLKRATWEKTRARRGTWRALSLLFLLFIILGTLFAFFYILPQLHRPDSKAPAVERGR